MSYLNFEQGDIAVIELPFSNYTGSKLRPVLVVSSSSFNRNNLDLVVAKITGTKLDSDLIIEINNGQLVEGALKKKSYIDTGFLMAVEKSLATKRIAKINQITLAKVKEKLANIFSL
ncbi:TPA: type II toxin-antitoxin system PemK/MazF family toxin [Candidatus Micrarchaeota archaeon]|nr:type II toxin-antitoxin system PemK/MazF family toxin [Candidatus Micrarchaeota archaeon]